MEDAGVDDMREDEWRTQLDTDFADHQQHGNRERMTISLQIGRKNGEAHVLVCTVTCQRG